MTTALRESALYPAVKALLEGQGYEVKSEIGGADVVALRPPDPPVIVELKLAFSLALFHQAVARLSVTDAVYCAVLHRPGKRARHALSRNVALARRLGLGVMTVRPDDALVTLHCDPAPGSGTATRQAGALLREFARRQGDPNRGGQTPVGLVTAYRQDARRIASFLAERDEGRGAEVAAGTGVGSATRMLADNHYGWFERVSRGVYRLSEEGRAAVARQGRDGF